MLFFLWWAAATFSGIESWRLPGPGVVLDRGIAILSRPNTWARIGVTAGEAVLGSALGSAVALPLGWLIYRFRLVRAAVEPFLGATQAIPSIALAPLLVLWTGYGTWSIATLCALIVFFPILVSTVLGLRHIDAEVLEAAELDGASGLHMVFFMEAPLASPSILAGLRNGFTLSITGAIVGEMIMGGSGIGQSLEQTRTNVDTGGTFVFIIILCLMAMSVYVLIRAMEKRTRLYTSTTRTLRSSS
ncbi:MAG: ABC transporter permease [Actinomycetaceae bacterium]|nr:ABC transporter permease [Actinomycetaceae bacterium]